WLPWTLFFLIPALEEKKFFPLMWTSACLCLCLWEGYPQIVYYTLLVVGFYLLRVLWLRPGEWKDVFLAGFLLLGGMIALGACQIFPSSEFIPRSNRWGWGYSDIMTDYLTPDRLKHFWTPDFLGNPFNISYVGKWGYHEIVNYIGLIPLVFFGAGLLAWGRIRLYGWFFTIALLFTTLSLGDSTWVSRTLFRGFYYLVPGFSHNRSIGRMMVITCFAMACAAGLVFDAWVRWEKAIRAR